MVAGGPQFDTPDFADSVPPDPANQGGSDTVHMQAPMTSSRPRTRMSMASPQDVNQKLRGYRTEPVGGSFMPSNAVQGSLDTGSAEKSNAAY